LGESIGSVQKFTTPLEAATTSSLEALKEFSIGQEAHSKFDDDNAIPHLKRAVELDPTFAMAWAVLGICYNNTGDSQQSSVSLQKAFDVKDRASEREKFYISSHYYGTFRGQLDKQIETLEQWIQAYPRDGVPLDNLSLAEQDSGQPEKALGYASEAMKVSPKDHYAYQNLATSYQYLNRYDEAKAVADQAVAQKIDPWSVHMVLYWTAFVRGDEAAMQREIAQSSGKVQETILVLLAAQGECAQGKIKKARESFARAASAAQGHGAKEWEALSLAGDAYCNAETGFTSEARQSMNAALAVATTAETETDAARLFARTGDATRAEKFISDLEKERPFDTLINQVRLPTARALLALQRNQPAQAVAALEPARPYDLTGERRSVGTFLAMYVRGEAYLRSHDGANAAVEYQKIVDHRGIHPTSQFLSLARLGLGRAYALQGDTAKAKSAYQDFFALWKDADADVPLLKTAKAEYEKLK
jgi:tetratricopeptide (TPR) repeat protein